MRVFKNMLLKPMGANPCLLPETAHHSTDPTHHPKRHPDRIRRFAIIHFQDTHTDRWNRRQVSKNSAYACYIDRQRRANNTKDASSIITIFGYVSHSQRTRNGASNMLTA